MAKHGMILLVVGAILLVGCGKDDKTASSSAPGLAAVVDLDGIAKAVGLADEMNRELTAYGEALRAELQRKYAALQKQYDDKKTEIGANPTEQQRQELVQLEANSNAVLQQLGQSGGQLFASRRAELMGSYQERVIPIAKRIAEQRGMTIVLGARAQALAWDSSVDITEAVLAEVWELRKSGAFTITVGAPATQPAP